MIGAVMSFVVAAAGAGVDSPEAPSERFAGNNCIECHRDLPGRSSEIVELEWRQSVHYDANVVCDDCHGGDAAVPREQFDSREAWKRAAHLERDSTFLLMEQQEERFKSRARGRSVSYFCGKCHATIKEKYLGSAHGAFGDPTCLYCHGQGSHEISPATIDIIDTTADGRCSQCHEASTMEVVGRIEDRLGEIEQQIQRSGERYEQLRAWGYQNLELEELHHHADEVRSKLRRVFHSFDLREISNFTDEIQGMVDRTDAAFGLVRDLRQTKRHQTFIGLAAVLVLLTLAALLVYYKRAFLDTEHEQENSLAEAEVARSPGDEQGDLGETALVERAAWSGGWAAERPSLTERRPSEGSAEDARE